jgi:hypothetical protein
MQAMMAVWQKRRQLCLTLPAHRTPAALKRLWRLRIPMISSERPAVRGAFVSPERGQ